jgi:hypothetical protein
MKVLKSSLAVLALASVGLSAQAKDNLKTNIHAGIGTGHISDYAVLESNEFSYNAGLDVSTTMDKVTCNANVAWTGSNGFKSAPLSATNNSILDLGVNCGMDFENFAHISVGYLSHESTDTAANSYDVKGVNVQVKGGLDKVGWKAAYQKDNGDGNIWLLGLGYKMDEVELGVQHAFRKFDGDATKKNYTSIGATVGLDNFAKDVEIMKNMTLDLGYATDDDTSTKNGFVVGLSYSHNLS